LKKIENRFVKNLSKIAKLKVFEGPSGVGGTSETSSLYLCRQSFVGTFVDHLCRPSERIRTQPNDFLLRVFRVLRGVPSSQNRTKQNDFTDRSVLDHAVPTTYDDAFTSRSIFREEKSGLFWALHWLRFTSRSIFREEKSHDRK
jgi:hypothetical protein